MIAATSWRRAALQSALLLLATSSLVHAAAPPPYRPPPGVGGGPSLVPPLPPEPPRAGAKFDMTGTWVAIVNEDYQWRMITPPKGEFSSLPLTAAAVAVANNWNLEADNAAGLQQRARSDFAFAGDHDPDALESEVGGVEAHHVACPAPQRVGMGPRARQQALEVERRRRELGAIEIRLA